MSLLIHKISATDLFQYASISMTLAVKTVFQIHPIKNGLGGLELREESVNPSYIKDYDADAGSKPTEWTSQFDIQNWGIFLATQNDQPVAGNVPACRFYARQGCHLGAINQYGYSCSPVVHHEAMLLWYLDL